jgi:hypothetical protein
LFFFYFLNLKIYIYKLFEIKKEKENINNFKNKLREEFKSPLSLANSEQQFVKTKINNKLRWSVFY